MSSSSDIVKALLTRIIFACHIIVTVWWVVQVTRHEKFWYLAFFDGLLCLETLFSLWFRRGQEFKWFSPSIFCHLAAIIPCAWVLEFHLLGARKDDTSLRQLTPIPSKSRVSMTSLDFRQALASKRISRDILLMSHNYSRGLPRDYLPDFRRDYYQPHLVEAGNTVLENSCSSEVSQFNNNIETQTITGRDQTRGPGRLSLDVGQMRPKRPTGRMTLSKTSPNLALDDSRHTRPDQTTPSSLFASDPNMKAEATEEGNHVRKSRIDSELVTILMSLFMQDGPFLTFRLFIIARYQAYDYMIIFLTAKNTLVLMLQVYRLCVLHCSCYDHMENDFSPDNIIDANARLKNVQVAIAHYNKRDLEQESENEPNLRNQFSFSPVLDPHNYHSS
ncbi:PREDICTED: uncharacterized protein LOC107347525 [Acropora digitifera]|uniref:uncharacterized protein LOC107347525 n=1 Tax=Acropora digitifera TaxID=70779 RepID=UPI00077B2356|nr:PREDICTED: uncharacterized protein LOC107347525 [Acropora digitifera]